MNPLGGKWTASREWRPEFQNVSHLTLKCKATDAVAMSCTFSSVILAFLLLLQCFVIYLIVMCSTSLIRLVPSRGSRALLVGLIWWLWTFLRVFPSPWYPLFLLMSHSGIQMIRTYWPCCLTLEVPLSMTMGCFYSSTRTILSWGLISEALQRPTTSRSWRNGRE
jgi:hypothetical protein